MSSKPFDYEEKNAFDDMCVKVDIFKKRLWK